MGLASAEISEKIPKNGLKYGFLSNSSGHINKVCKILYYLPKKNGIQDEVVLNMFTKLTRKR